MASQVRANGIEDSVLLGAILVRQFGLTLAELQLALDEQREKGGLLGEILTRRGVVTEDTVRKALVFQSLARAKRQDG